mmetsp:Transcript_29454/g.26875  ORF Transcript_29454/g.26875 Transcript_29454/m.26875 type:complete len:300 (+) Transcript_29454:1-900(+)
MRWRYLIVWISIPALISFVFVLLLVKETPRFAISRDFAWALDILKAMFRINHKKELEVTEQEKDDLKQWVEYQKEKKVDGKISKLFKGKNLRNTICLGIIWFGTNFLYYGSTYMVPIVEGKSSNKLEYSFLYVSILSELPGCLLTYFIIENKELGRQKILLFFLVLCSLGCFGAYFLSDIVLVFLFVIKFSAVSVFNLISTFTPELYNTNVRGTGTGLASSIARVSGIIMPWVIIKSMNVSQFFPFMTSGLFGVAAAIACFCIKKDPTGKPLDIYDSENTDGEYEEDKGEEETQRLVNE